MNERPHNSIQQIELGRYQMRCPLCGREMTVFPGVKRGRISEIVYHCEVHGLLGRPPASVLLSRVSNLESEKQATESKNNKTQYQEEQSQPD
jgi:hypothetical protein